MSAHDPPVSEKSGTVEDSVIQGSRIRNQEESVDHSQMTLNDSQRSVSFEDQKVTEGHRMGDIQSLLTHQTPEVALGHEYITPLTKTTTREPSTPTICIGRESRRNSVSLMQELEEAEGRGDSRAENLSVLGSNCNDTLNKASQCTDDIEFLNNVYELHCLYQPENQCCLYTLKLQDKVKEQAITIESLLNEKQEQGTKIDDFSRKLFQKEQQLKIADDRVKQLENSNNYRKEVTRLEGVLEQVETEMRLLKEELTKSKERNNKLQEEKQKLMKEQKASEENNLDRIKELEERERKIIEDFGKNQELVARDLEGKANMLKELSEELKKSQNKISILEENKTFLLNENVTLKNKAKVLNQRKKEEQNQNDKAPEKVSNEEEEKDNSAIRKELKTLQRELKRFQEFTFNKLDELAGRGSSSSNSSLSSTSCDEQESGVETVLQSQKRKTPRQRKQWENAHLPQVLRYEANHPVSAELSPDETGRTIRLVPGHQTYSERVRGSTASPQTAHDFDAAEKAKKIESYRARRQARESKTLIFSSSITRDITRQQRAFNERCKKSDVTIHEFKGKKACDIVKYMIPHLEDELPSSVIFVAGGNDLPNHDISTDQIRQVANCLLEGGLKCRNEYGVNNVFISSIMPRENSAFQGNRHCLNKVLRDMCIENGFYFINNNNIVLSTHGHRDGIHLNYEGSDLLCDNLLNVLNG